MDKYKSGADLLGVGVVPGGDMTLKSCSTKLAYLFGRLGPKNIAKIREYLLKDLRGELSPSEKYHRKIYSHIGLTNTL